MDISPDRHAQLQLLSELSRNATERQQVCRILGIKLPTDAELEQYTRQRINRIPRVPHQRHYDEHESDADPLNAAQAIFWWLLVMMMAWAAAALLWAVVRW